MSVHFEERSGVVPCKTPWGSWSQTMEEVFIEVNVPHGTSAKEVKCHLGTRDIELHVKGKEIFKVSPRVGVGPVSGAEASPQQDNFNQTETRCGIQSVLLSKRSTNSPIPAGILQEDGYNPDRFQLKTVVE